VTDRFLRKVDSTEERPLAVSENVRVMVGPLEGNGDKERKLVLMLHEGKLTRELEGRDGLNREGKFSDGFVLVDRVGRMWGERQGVNDRDWA